MKRKEVRATRYLFFLLLFVIGLRVAFVQWYEAKISTQLEDMVQEIDLTPVEKIEVSDSISIEKTTIVKNQFSKKPKSNIPSNSPKSKRKSIKRAVVNINQADSTQLSSLYGIGPVLSARIVKFRNRLGGYHSIDQLRDVYGLSPETYDRIKSRLTCRGELQSLNIRKATFKEILRHPYLEFEEVKGIMKYQKRTGPIKSMDDLIIATGKSAADAEKLWPYLHMAVNEVAVAANS